MPFYDYQCKHCKKVQEELHSMLAEPRIVCKCGRVMQRLLSNFNTPKDKRYEFTTDTIEPGTQIRSKRQWEGLLKRNHLTDDLGIREKSQRVNSGLRERRKKEKKVATRVVIKKEISKAYAETR